MKKKCYLGLDISTSHIGICISTKEDEILYWENLDFSKLGDLDLFEKTKMFKLKMIDIFDEYAIDRTYIEKALLAFVPGGSRIQTIVLLQQFNILCQNALREIEKEYTLVPIMTAMKQAIGIGRKPKHIKEDKKVWTAKIFQEKHPEIEMKLFKVGKNKGKIHADMYDVVDAWFCSRCFKIK